MIAIWLAMLMTSCSVPARTPEQLREIADALPIPPAIHLLDTRTGTESLHQDPRCWSNYLFRVYATESMDLDEVLKYFQEHLSEGGWSQVEIQHIPSKGMDGLTAVSLDRVMIEVSNNYRFVVFPGVSVVDEVKKHKTLVFVGLTQRIYSGPTTLLCN